MPSLDLVRSLDFLFDFFFKAKPSDYLQFFAERALVLDLFSVLPEVALLLLLVVLLVEFLVFIASFLGFASII